MTLNELNDYAGQHEVIAENLSSQIIAELTRYIQELKAERKSVHILMTSLFCWVFLDHKKIFLKTANVIPSILNPALPEPHTNPW